MDSRFHGNDKERNGNDKERNGNDSGKKYLRGSACICGSLLSVDSRVRGNDMREYGNDMNEYCPLLLMAAKSQGATLDEGEKEKSRCLKMDCAWYVMYDQPPAEGCAIMKISDFLKLVTLRMPKL